MIGKQDNGNYRQPDATIEASGMVRGAA